MRLLGSADLLFILWAARWTVLLSVIAALGGGGLGLAVALGRVSPRRWVAGLALVYVRVIQSTPLLMQLFLVYFGANIFGFSLEAFVAAALGLVVNAAAFLGEIWRGCIEAVPRGQDEAARSLGLPRWKRMVLVVLPQAARLAVAPTVGFLVQLVKNTSLAAIIGFVELTRSGQIVNNAVFRPFLVFSIVAAIYFLLCWPLSWLSRRLELSLTRGTRKVAAEVAGGMQLQATSPRA